MATEQKRTSLSAGLMIYDILSKDDAVRRIVRKVFPLYVDKADLPYVAYRCADLQHNPTKAGMPGADTVTVEVGCYAATYDGVVALAEMVRDALDYKKGEVSGLAMRSCMLVKATETWADDAYEKLLTFEVRI